MIRRPPRSPLMYTLFPDTTLFLSFQVATIDASVDRGFIKQRIVAGRVGPCGPVGPLTAEAVDGAVDVVAQMGAEPYLEALRDDPDIIRSEEHTSELQTLMRNSYTVF